MDKFNLDHIFSNPVYVESTYEELSEIKMELDRAEDRLLITMSAAFPEWSVQEWMKTYVDPIKDEIISLKDKLATILSQKSFPVRPIKL